MPLNVLGACARAARTPSRLAVLAVGLLLAGCAAAPPQLPEPRPIIIHSGARLRADVGRMTEVNEWVTRERRNIEDDPTFLVSYEPAVDELYVWENFEIEGDTVHVDWFGNNIDTRLLHQLYGHMHLMVRMGRQDEWIPEAPDATGYELERAILERVADAWLLARSVFDTHPYGPLDELMYANESGYLDAFVFTARPTEYAEARAEWARANPGATDAYREWFVETFNREPPGLRGN